MVRTERRASEVGDGFDPDGFARCDANHCG